MKPSKTKQARQSKQASNWRRFGIWSCV